MADRVAVMNDGRILQVSRPDDAYADPENEFVAGFLGSPSMNRLRVEVRRTDGEAALVRDGLALVALPDDVALEGRRAVTLGVRPEDVTLTADPSAAPVTATVRNSEYQGNTNFVHLHLDGDALTVRTDPEFAPSAGDRVGVRLPPASVYLFDVETGATLRSAARAPGSGTPDPVE